MDDLISWVILAGVVAFARSGNALAWLANTRGMTELVVSNVRFKLGAINATMFGIGVVMAVATPLMTGPMLDQLGYGKRRAQTV